MPLAPYADGVFIFFWHRKVRQKIITLLVACITHLLKKRLVHVVVLRSSEFSSQSNHIRLTLQKCWEELPYEVPPNGAVFQWEISIRFLFRRLGPIFPPDRGGAIPLIDLRRVFGERRSCFRRFGALLLSEVAMKDILRYLLCGLAMGAADVVPGVSGGTIAFITGIYQPLLDGIQTFDMAFFKLFFRGRFRQALSRIPWSFLLPLVAGIACSIFSLAKLVLYLLHVYPIVVWSFFFGLIVASIVLLFRDLKRRGPGVWTAFAVGAAFAWWLTGAETMRMAQNPPMLFLAGFIAICAMILPGISGAFILVLLGQYQFVLTAVTAFNLSVLVLFALGGVCGLLLFARVLNYCLRRYHTATLAILIGVMAGSLRTVWPWQEANMPALPPSLGFETALAALCCAAGVCLPPLLNALPTLLRPRGIVR